jgi:hypothetical protein
LLRKNRIDFASVQICEIFGSIVTHYRSILFEMVAKDGAFDLKATLMRSKNSALNFSGKEHISILKWH